MTKTKLAVVGIDILLSQAADLGGFERALYFGQSLAPPASLEGIVLTAAELKRLQLDNSQAAGLSTENKILLKVIARALSGLDSADSRRGLLLFTRASDLVFAAGQRFVPGEIDPSRAEMERAQFREGASRLFARQVDLSLVGNPIASGLREAQTQIENGEIDYAVLAGAFISTPELSQICLKAGIHLHAGPPNLGFDRSVEGWTFGEGAAAVVVTGKSLAQTEKIPVYAVIEGTGFAARDLANPKKHLVPTFVSSDTVYQSCQQAFVSAHWDPEKIGYLEVLASGFGPLDTAEIGGLSRAYATPGSDLTCALGSVQVQSGYLPSMAGIAGLVRACLCLHDRFIPAVPGWTGPKKVELFANAPFYVATDPRTWFLDSHAQKRSAAVNAIGWDGSCAHVILSDEINQPLQSNQFLTGTAISLFPVAGNSLEDLIANLNSLNNNLTGVSLSATARTAFKNYQDFGQARYTACLVAQDFNELEKEIGLALRDLPAAFEKKKPWQTLAGSFFTPEPVGPDAGVAFVYPGAFNSYAGLGRDLFTLFPQIYERAARLTSDISATIQERHLYPRSLEALSKDQLQANETELNTDPVAMITSGSMISFLFTMVLRDIFKIHPSTAFGYSLGEIGMLFATGVWDQADAVRSKLHASPLFPERLSGPQEAIREHWHLPPSLEGGPIWANYFLMSPAETVQNALKNHSRVYLTHINTPRQVVIGGDPQECQQVITELKCTSLRAPFDFALHCEAMRSEHNRLVEMLTWPVALAPQTRLYTAAGFAPLEIESGQIAEKISDMLCDNLDFPNLVRQTYADGVRIFIELGANANCSKWIEDILRGEAFTAVAINRRGVDDLTSIVRMLARLVSNRLPLDLKPLYMPE